MRAFRLVCALLALGCLAARPVAAADYQPRETVSGVLRSWGADGLAHVMAAWERGFATHHPDIRFDDHLLNTALAMPGLAAGAADLGLIGREAYRNEIVAYTRAHHHPPFVVQIATGAFRDDVKKTFPPVVFVHRDNPIDHLTLAQLDGIFGAPRSGGWDFGGTLWRAESGRGADRNIRRWGQLGLAAPWQDQAIHPIGFVVGPRSGVAHFFAERVFGGGDTWSEVLREVWYEHQPNGSIKDLSAVMTEAVAADRYAIGYGAARFRTPDVKPVALAVSEAGPFVQATAETIRNRQYPLARPVYIFANRAPGAPLDPKVREFLRYVLSPQGQEAISAEGDYFPLPPAIAQKELERLD